MKTIYALEPLEPSIFLAGPTPRKPHVVSWRPEALEILKDFPGTVYVPESSTWQAHDRYDEQIRWEWTALHQATAIVFWVPRTLDEMPAMTTNVEFGNFVQSGKCILGYPETAVKMRYLHELAKKYNVPVFHELKPMLDFACIFALDQIKQASV